MVQQSLIEYVQRLLQQGYDPGTIRTTLLNAGYSPYDVDTAMRIAGAPGKRVNTKLLLVVFLILLVLAAGILIILRVMQAPPVVLNVSASLFSTEVKAGQDVVINVEIQNPSGRETTGLIDYKVSGPAGRVASKTESFKVTTQTSVPNAVSIPSTAEQGAYSVEISVSYAKRAPQVLRRSFNVVEHVSEVSLPSEALEEREEERARELQLTCPGGCDDLNFCTEDSCVQGICVNKPIEPCCGNYKCEPGESAGTCPLDCAERPVGPDEIRQRAKEIALSDVSEAVGVCESLAQRTYVDACLSDVSEESSNKGVCSSIVDDDIRDSCYITFAYKDDFSVCKEITNPYMKNSCNSLSSLSEVQANLPG